MLMLNFAENVWNSTTGKNEKKKWFVVVINFCVPFSFCSASYVRNDDGTSSAEKLFNCPTTIATQLNDENNNFCCVHWERLNQFEIKINIQINQSNGNIANNSNTFTVLIYELRFKLFSMKLINTIANAINVWINWWAHLIFQNH